MKEFIKIQVKLQRFTVAVMVWLKKKRLYGALAFIFSLICLTKLKRKQQFLLAENILAKQISAKHLQQYRIALITFKLEII